MKTGHAHVLNGPSFVELAQDGAHLGKQVGSNSAPIILFEEPFQALMPKPDDHFVL